MLLPTAVACGLTVRDEDEAEIVDLLDLVELGYDLYATPGTADGIRGAGLRDDRLPDRRTSTPDALDIMREGACSSSSTSRPSRWRGSHGNMMRRLAVELNIPFVTTLRGAVMEVAAMSVLAKGDPRPRRLEVHY